jgi:hypothetical protein
VESSGWFFLGTEADELKWSVIQIDGCKCHKRLVWISFAILISYPFLAKKTENEFINNIIKDLKKPHCDIQKL